MKHFILPDCQVKPGVPTDHLIWAGKHCVKHKPDVIVCIGDFADMESLSSYDVGKKSFEGRSYINDIKAAKHAMALFLAPIFAEQVRREEGHRKRWNPRLVLTMGNHEHRITRAVENDRKLEDLMSLQDLDYEGFGWEVVPFLQPVTINGIIYCHYLTSGVMGRPIGTARALVTKKHMSCVVGHQQGRDISYDKRGDGRRIAGLIAGSFYQHDEGYLDYQSNQHWRGVVMLNEVEDGSFDECFVSLGFLRKKYGSKDL